MDKVDGVEPSNSGNLTTKVISIAAGEAHTLALTGDGSVYSWGRGTFGRLGTGSEADQLFPIRVEFNQTSGEKLKIVGISAGAYHSLALADDGSVWSWGYNTYGQLGVLGENSLDPRPVDSFFELSSPGTLTDGLETETKAPLKMSSVKAGGMMSLAIDNLGALWMWGNCSSENSSVEGEFLLVSSSSPIPVWNLHGRIVVKVACGNEHIVALVSAGETHKGSDLVCYSWGNNSHGQLGLGDTVSRRNPEILRTFNPESPWAVYEVACGAFHTAVLSHRKSPSEALVSVCWTCGLGENGQLGHGTTRNVLYPEVVNGLPHNASLISVDCGLFHTSVVSSDGEVWSWGMEKGLGLCPDASFSGTDAGDALSPILILYKGLYGSSFPEPVQVACGAAHTVLLANAGYRLWSWGRGRSGVLGNGKADDCYSPNPVLWPPLAEDFKEGAETESRDDRSEQKKLEKNPEEILEIEKRLSAAMDEMELLRSKFSIMERYASILHGSIFGKPFEEEDIPISLRDSGTFEIAKVWDSMLESSDRGRLVRLEMSYRSMLAGVKDKLMKHRIKEIMKECLDSRAAGN